MPFRCLSHTRISMKWRALICVHSYFAFYFSSCECLCILFSCLVLSFLLLSEMQMFVLRRLRSVKCHSLCTHTHNFLPQPTLLLCSHGEEKKHAQISAWEKVRWRKEQRQQQQNPNETNCENETNLWKWDEFCWGFTLFMFFFPSVLSSFHSFEIYLTHILGVFGFQFSLIERIRRDSKTLVSISYCWAGAGAAIAAVHKILL